MNFYPFHIGDYASATRHLTWTEDAAYRRLMDLYYVREDCLPAEKRQIYRLVLASTEEQRGAVDTVLEEFFEETPDGFRHKRCDLELANAQIKSAKAAQSARARWGDAKTQEVAVPSDNERNANASSAPSERTKEACEGNAPNTKTKTNTKQEAKASSDAYVPPEWVPLEQWGEFVRMRKAMRNVPFTGAAAKGVVGELEKLRAKGHDPAEMLTRAVTNGWRTVYEPKGQQSFGSPARGNAQEALEASNRAVAARFMENDDAGQR